MSTAGHERLPDLLPAWSDAFHRPDLPPAPALAGLPISPEWAFGDRRGRGVTVAVIDSGIDPSHPMVGSVEQFVSVEKDADAEDGVRFIDGPHDDLYGHGTACAGIIRALAPEVRLVSLRVLGPDLKGSATTFAHALDWCIEHDVQIANMSLSTSSERFLETFYDLVDQAAYRRLLLVSAMNNERKTTIPSEFSGVFSVACSPGTDPETFLCNPNGPAEWGAAGIDVEVAWTGGSTIVATGNSFAAPVVAGHLARLVATHPTITPWQARTVMAALAANAEQRDTDG